MEHEGTWFEAGRAWIKVEGEPGHQVMTVATRDGTLRRFIVRYYWATLDPAMEEYNLQVAEGAALCFGKTARAELCKLAGGLKGDPLEHFHLEVDDIKRIEMLQALSMHPLV